MSNNLLSDLLDLFSDKRTPEQKKRDRRKEILTLCLVGIVVVGIFVLVIIGAVHLVELVKSH